MATCVAALTKLDTSLELFTTGLYLHLLRANQPCSFYMFSKLIFVCRAVSSFMSGAVVAGFYNTMYPSLVDANVFSPPMSVALPTPVRHYARAVKKKRTVPQSQLSDLPPTMLKLDYAAVPMAQTTDDIIKRLLSLELASHREKLQLKTEQLISKVQRDENDRSSMEVQVATLTARIRNYQEHLQKNHKDKANKRRMLMAIDKRKKLLKKLRLVRYSAFERVCEQLGITYTFPPEYYRRATRRWQAKKAFCIKVFKAVQKQKAEQRKKMKQHLASKNTETTLSQ
ncbi:28S ribosomal protein S15, mitochondrial [Takifugu flavidus]|uniref:Small ribosomal subunit protein uS15m n=1 Tax=Takifugu flavidus TaxID=433684 RepID=A0A5C6PNW6_9TELE|nr:28S ribosomal protein S15, mitochondrial [Takifugu flavidus]